MALFKHKLEASMMIGDKQTQRAGDNSQLMQAGTINIYNGIDEKRAREICAETYAVARRDFTADAYACANERVQQFEDSLLPKMKQIEGALSAFADPSFQFLLTSAQRTAAATERDADYDMLSELLVCRITKGQARKNRAGISRAVEIIDKIDDDALCALTVVHAVNKVMPRSGSCKSGLKVLADLFEKLIYMELPLGTDWIDHLDILDTVRINSIGSFKKIADYYPDRLSGYSAAGICIDSENHKNALRILSEAGLNSSFLVPNELLDSYVKLPIARKEEINNLTVTQNVEVNGNPIHQQSRIINEKEIEALEAIWDLYNTDAEVKKVAVSAFMDEWDNYSSLRKLHIWWDSLPLAFDITQVGTVLAHTNARRCDKTIPELPLST